MRRVFIVFLFFFSIGAYAQDTTESDSINTVVETMPEFPGGEDALNKFLIKNVEYPRFERKWLIEGTAYVSFVVDKSGQIKDVTIHPGAEEKATKAMKKEAIRVVRKMPNWKPGTQQGKPVSVKYIIPIMFKFN